MFIGGFRVSRAPLDTKQGRRAFRKDVTFRRGTGHVDFFIPRLLLFARTLAPRTSPEVVSRESRKDDFIYFHYFLLISCTCA